VQLTILPPLHKELVTLKADLTPDYSALRYKPAVIALNLFECVVSQFTSSNSLIASLLIDDLHSSSLCIKTSAKTAPNAMGSALRLALLGLMFTHFPLSKPRCQIVILLASAWLTLHILASHFAVRACLSSCCGSYARVSRFLRLFTQLGFPFGRTGASLARQGPPKFSARRQAFE
jgi:hypothetical protein